MFAQMWNASSTFGADKIFVCHSKTRQTRLFLIFA